MIRSIHSLNVKATRNAVLAITLGVTCALPAVAQTTSTGSSATGATTTPTSVSSNTDGRDDRGDWGWIGLLGLAGLAGLMRKKDNTHDTKRTYSTNPR